MKGHSKNANHDRNKTINAPISIHLLQLKYQWYHKMIQEESFLPLHSISNQKKLEMHNFI